MVAALDIMLVTSPGGGRGAAIPVHVLQLLADAVIAATFFRGRIPLAHARGAWKITAGRSRGHETSSNPGTLRA